jgi:cytochrome c553
MGLPPAITALAGQPDPYLKAQLQAWQTGHTNR